MILIVEDSRSTAELLVRLLSDYDTVVALDLKSALARMDSCRPELILLDLILPDSKSDTLRSIREKDRFVPVIVVTGQIDPKVRLECLALGAVSFLQKGDFTFHDLRGAMNDAMLLSRLRNNDESS